MMEGVNFTKIYYKHFCKCYNISTAQQWYDKKEKINPISLEWMKGLSKPAYTVSFHLYEVLEQAKQIYWLKKHQINGGLWG
jgi:hypothetical protein